MRWYQWVEFLLRFFVWIAAGATMQNYALGIIRNADDTITKASFWILIFAIFITLIVDLKRFIEARWHHAT